MNPGGERAPAAGIGKAANGAGMGFDELTPQGGVTFVIWRWRRARLVSSAPFSMNLRYARRKRWESTNCRRRFAIGLVGLETEPMQPIRCSARPRGWSMRLTQ